MTEIIIAIVTSVIGSGGVAMHPGDPGDPGDQGMRAIADRLVAALDM